jgi:hypothetical protein
MPGPNRFSRYRFTTAENAADGRLLLSDRVPYRFRELADNRQHVVHEGDTWFNLAGRYFSAMPRASGFWWVIADFNGAHDPTVPPAPGAVVIVPSVRTLQEEILNERRRRND